MLEKELKILIPKKLSDFPKIRRIGDPYHFYKWDLDQNQQNPILRYWFWNDKKTRKFRKRVFINEFEDLLKLALDCNGLNRTDFERVCPNTKSDGGCGFAVIVGILEYLQVVELEKPGAYLLANKEIIKELLGQKKEK